MELLRMKFLKKEVNNIKKQAKKNKKTKVVDWKEQQVKKKGAKVEEQKEKTVLRACN